MLHGLGLAQAQPWSNWCRFFLTHFLEPLQIGKSESLGTFLGTRGGNRGKTGEGYKTIPNEIKDLAPYVPRSSPLKTVIVLSSPIAPTNNGIQIKHLAETLGAFFMSVRISDVGAHSRAVIGPETPSLRRPWRLGLLHDPHALTCQTSRPGCWQYRGGTFRHSQEV